MGRLMNYPVEALDAVFSNESRGNTPAERARTSKQMFVRSQVQVAFASEGAKGRMLAAQEALESFGWELLLRVASEGAAPLISSQDEPACTLRSRREELGLQIPTIAKRLKIDEQAVLKAETVGLLSPIRILESICQLLALDERKIGYLPNAGRDHLLGVRLRELSQASDAYAFDAGTVLGLAEAAWVISRQHSLSSSTCKNNTKHRIFSLERSPDFSFPTWKVGYALAQKTRDALELSPEEPIESLRDLIEGVLDLPLVQLNINPKFAGATISNGDSRGIAINEAGMNVNVWVRRMTLCHEIGHLLWDPDERLNKLNVDEYTGIDPVYIDNKKERDIVEIRANAFAIAFLAPPTAVSKIAAEESDPFKAVCRVMTTFGISGTAAKHHLSNITGLDTSGVSTHKLPLPGDEWTTAENLSIDYFPIKETPITRRGKFAWHVSRLYLEDAITGDTAASYLHCSENDVKDHIHTINEMWPSTYAS